MGSAADEKANSALVAGLVQRAMALMVSAALPVFWTRVVFVDVAPTFTLPNERLPGFSAMAGAVGAETVKLFVATISSPWFGLFGSGVHRVPYVPTSYSLPYQETFQVYVPGVVGAVPVRV